MTCLQHRRCLLVNGCGQRQIQVRNYQHSQQTCQLQLHQVEKWPDSIRSGSDCPSPQTSADLSRQPLTVAVLDEQLVAVLYKAVTPGQSGRELHAHRDVTNLIGTYRDRLSVAGLLIRAGWAVFEPATVSNDNGFACQHRVKFCLRQSPAGRSRCIRSRCQTACPGFRSGRERRLSWRRHPLRLPILRLAGCNLLLWDCRRCRDRRRITGGETADIRSAATDK